MDFANLQLRTRLIAGRISGRPRTEPNQCEPAEPNWFESVWRTEPGRTGTMFCIFPRFSFSTTSRADWPAHTRVAQRRRPLRLNGYDDYDGNGDDRCGTTAGQRAHTRAAGGPIPGRPAEPG